MCKKKNELAFKKKKVNVTLRQKKYHLINGAAKGFTTNKKF